MRRSAAYQAGWAAVRLGTGGSLDMLIEVGQRATTACDPTQKTTDHVEATPCAKPNESLLKETRGLALHNVQVCFNFPCLH